MKAKELEQFLKNKMRMSHIYQPLLIRALLNSGGKATLRQLALEFLEQDESQILYYEKKIKKMPVQKLRKPGVIKIDGDLITLNLENIPYEDRAALRALCEEKISEYL